MGVQGAGNSGNSGGTQPPRLRGAFTSATPADAPPNLDTSTAQEIEAWLMRPPYAPQGAGIAPPAGGAPLTDAEFQQMLAAFLAGPPSPAPSPAATGADDIDLNALLGFNPPTAADLLAPPMQGQAFFPPHAAMASTSAVPWPAQQLPPPAQPFVYPAASATTLVQPVTSAQDAITALGLGDCYPLLNQYGGVAKIAKSQSGGIAVDVGQNMVCIHRHGITQDKYALTYKDPTNNFQNAVFSKEDIRWAMRLTANSKGDSKTKFIQAVQWRYAINALGLGNYDAQLKGFGHLTDASSPQIGAAISVGDGDDMVCISRLEPTQDAYTVGFIDFTGQPSSHVFSKEEIKWAAQVTAKSDKNLILAFKQLALAKQLKNPPQDYQKFFPSGAITDQHIDTIDRQQKLWPDLNANIALLSAVIINKDLHLYDASIFSLANLLRNGNYHRKSTQRKPIMIFNDGSDNNIHFSLEQANVAYHWQQDTPKKVKTINYATFCRVMGEIHNEPNFKVNIKEVQKEVQEELNASSSLTPYPLQGG